MSRKAIRITLIVSAAVMILWGAVFVTDFIRCGSLKAPLFVVAAGVTADDGGSGIYRGLGYTVDVEKYIDAQYGVCIRSVEMSVLGKVISASVACEAA